MTADGGPVPGLPPRYLGAGADPLGVVLNAGLDLARRSVQGLTWTMRRRLFLTCATRSATCEPSLLPTLTSLCQATGRLRATSTRTGAFLSRESPSLVASVSWRWTSMAGKRRGDERSQPGAGAVLNDVPDIGSSGEFGYEVLCRLRADADDGAYDAPHPYRDPSPGDPEQQGEWDEGRDIRHDIPKLRRVGLGGSGREATQQHADVVFERPDGPWIRNQHSGGDRGGVDEYEGAGYDSLAARSPGAGRVLRLAVELVCLRLGIGAAGIRVVGGREIPLGVVVERWHGFTVRGGGKGSGVAGPCAPPE